MIRVIKSRSVRLAGDVTRMGEMRNAYKILAGILEGKRPLGVGGSVWTGLSWLKIRISRGLL
jgi:hypothetical protein